MRTLFFLFFYSDADPRPFGGGGGGGGGGGVVVGDHWESMRRNNTAEITVRQGPSEGKRETHTHTHTERERERERASFVSRHGGAQQ